MEEMHGQTDQSTPAPQQKLRANTSLRALLLLQVLIPVIAVGVVVASLFQSQKQLHNDARQRNEQTSATSLARLAEGLIAADDLTGLAALLTQWQTELELDRCLIRLPDGRLIASGAEQSPLIESLPESWTGVNFPQIHVGAAALIKVPERGVARVEVKSAPASMATSQQPWIASIIAAAVGIAAGILLFSRFNARVRALSSVESALNAFKQGETDAKALRVVAKRAGPASAWNALLDERQQLVEKASDRATAERGDSGARPDGAVQAAADAMPTGIAVADIDGNVRYANGAAAVLLGATLENVIGQPFVNVMKDEIISEAWDDLTSGKRRRVACEVERQIGESSNILRISILKTGRTASERLVVLIDDVTQQRAADHARDEFIAHATHELRAPLTAIRLHIEMLLEDDVDPKEAETSINIINLETRRLERMVGDMLSVAEIEAGSIQIQFGDVRLDQLFDELKISFEQSAREKNIDLSFDLPPKMPVIQGDRDKLVQTLHNLIGNAIKYTPESGSVVVRVDDEDQGLRVAVSDTGIGIDGEECNKVFEKFYRANDRRIKSITGSGLGLALAREIVRLHGGDINVESEVDKGSTFSFTLPSRSEAA